jgi:hypothetical protein
MFVVQTYSNNTRIEHKLPSIFDCSTRKINQFMEKKVSVTMEGPTRNKDFVAACGTFLDEEEEESKGSDWELLSDNFSVMSMNSSIFFQQHDDDCNGIVGDTWTRFRDQNVLVEKRIWNDTDEAGASLSPELKVSKPCCALPLVPSDTWSRTVRGEQDDAFDDDDDDTILMSAEKFETKDHRPREKHTLRRTFVHGVYYHDKNGRRKVMDKDHIPATKTHGRKLYEHKSNRQWLRRERRHEKRVQRQDRKEALAAGFF